MREKNCKQRGTRILEELWYGNIEPAEYNTSSREYRKLLEQICRSEEKLKITK